MPTVIILVLLVIGFFAFAAYYSELLWYRSVDESGVFVRRIGVHVGLFLVFGAVLGGVVGGNAYLAFRLRPVYIPSSQEQQSLDRYRMALEPVRRLLLIAASVLLGVIAGLSAATQWKTYLLWRHSTPFGSKDPQFGLDTSFFVFKLPWYRFLLDYGFSLLLLTIVAATVVHYLYGGIRVQSGGDRTSDAARVHLSVLLGLFVLLKAVAYVLDRYSLEVSDSTVGRSDFTGLTYTDINAVLPAKTILAWVALICAVLFFANVWRRTWLLPGLGLGSLLVAAVLIGGLYPALFHQLRVKPSEADKESGQITRNIAATRTAYGLDRVVAKSYTTARDTDVAAAASSPTLAAARLIDPYVVSPTFTASQQSQTWYEFPDPLDIDRYTIGGKQVETVVAVREVDASKLNQSQRNWTNERTVYTHGYGFVAAPAAQPDTEGEPKFFAADAFGEYQQQIYFGEESPEYSIVGAPPRSQPVEADDPNAGTTSTYQGKGGVPIGGLFDRLVYAAKYRDTNLLLSSRVNSASQILYDRQPRERVEKVAPWLTVDGDPYPAVVNGRIVWIVDGYTTSNSYPYSTRQELGAATTDIVTKTSSVVAAQDDRRVNYIRNSVKATVDAYSGKVTLYAWDETDPVLKAWRNAFPGTVLDRSFLEKDTQLLSHVRYPEDLFKVQRELYSRYHVTDAKVFYSNNDFWRIPSDPTRSDETQDVPPYYLTVQMPGTAKPSFSLTTPFVPIGNRENLTAFMSVDSDPTDSTAYGTLRVLLVPTSGSGSQTFGPQLAQSSFKSNVGIAQQISLLSRGGASEVDYGNLLTLPAGGGFVYVEPVYVKPASGTARFPTLQLVLVSDGTNAAYGSTLEAALQNLAQGGSPTTGATGGSGGTGSSTSPTPSPSASSGGTTTGGATAVPAQVTALVDEALRIYQEGQRDLQAKDTVGYLSAQTRLQAVLQQLQQLTGSATLPSVGPSSSASATPSAVPSPSPSG
ncbi:hypothetical protein EV189_2594 [Motilibacter rhizosphaerae]|uniref:UPF0182 protein EV189_2594 n=1 Tax=Motilibacter rhizosphaerae TaxID=598652 RepID=A0A4Q7NRB4_9ACTN|nr:hypothetical protein EV189_2594 [Motilibacter rhizosphaerae]